MIDGNSVVEFGADVERRMRRSSVFEVVSDGIAVGGCLYDVIDYRVERRRVRYILDDYYWTREKGREWAERVCVRIESEYSKLASDPLWKLRVAIGAKRYGVIMSERVPMMIRAHIYYEMRTDQHVIVADFITLYDILLRDS